MPVSMQVHQTSVKLRLFPRGCHLVTREVEEALGDMGGIRSGLCHVFIKHTSASLTLNENASPVEIKPSQNNAAHTSGLILVNWGCSIISASGRDIALEITKLAPAIMAGGR